MTQSLPAGSTAPVITSIASSPVGSRICGAPAGCVPRMRNRRWPRFSAPLSTAMPSMHTRSKGGWSRSAYTFSRNVLPTHCDSGSDSIGRHVNRAWMASSARCGVMSVPACMVKTRRRGAPPRLGSLLACRCLGLVDLQLLVEAPHGSLELVVRCVVLLDQDVLLLVDLLLLFGLQLRRVLGPHGIDFHSEAVHVRRHLAVVAIEIVLRGDHLVLGRGRAVRGRLRSRGVDA